MEKSFAKPFIKSQSQCYGLEKESVISQDNATAMNKLQNKTQIQSLKQQRALSFSCHMSTVGAAGVLHHSRMWAHRMLLSGRWSS